MAYAATTTGSPGGYGSSYDDSITDYFIDNINFSYWVVLDLPQNSLPNTNVIAVKILLEYNPSTVPWRESYLTVPAAAFIPYEDGYVFQDHVRYLYHLGPGDAGTYVAPVILPQNAKITKMTYYFYSTTINKATAIHLYRNPLGSNTSDQLASIYMQYSQGFGSWVYLYDISHRFNNLQNSYWLRFETDRNFFTVDVMGRAVTLEYIFYELWFPFGGRGRY